MNSPTEKPSKSKQPATEMFNPETLVLAKQKLMLAKMVWWLLRNHNATNGPTAIIDDEQIPLLWNLNTRDVDGKLQITADLLPDLTDEQISSIVEFLLGTTKTLVDVIEKFQLPQPPDYIEAALRNYVVRYDGKWIHPDEAATAHTD